MRRDAEFGIILINVLVILALAAVAVFAMLSLGELTLVRSQRFSEAGAAVALLTAGEQSAVAALRRDMRDAPEVDHAGEAWAGIAQAPVAVAGGVFSLEIRDAQDRFNLNRLIEGDASDSQLLRALVATAELPPETADRILAAIEDRDPLDTPGSLVERGALDADELAALSPFVSALPGPAALNLNGASLELLEAVFGSRIQARLIAGIRNQQGALTAENLDAASIVIPPGVGLQSSLFRLWVTARIGGALLSSESLLQRRDGPDGPEVVVIQRRVGPAGPVPAPPDPDG